MMEKATVILLETEQKKFIMRMKMTHEERFRAFMKSSRFKSKLEQAIIIKPNSKVARPKDLLDSEELERIKQYQDNN